MKKGIRGGIMIGTAGKTRPSSKPDECYSDDNISETVNTIKDHLQRAPSQIFGKSWCIYRVPRNLREIHGSTYDPKLVSIGPFHCDVQRLKGMEDHKLRFLLRLLSSTRYQKGTSDATIGRFVAAMEGLEAKTRACYSEIFNEIDSKKFVLMMILDGCFIVELLRLYAKCDKEYVDDPIITTRWMVPILRRDLLMLGNQLPFFVLQALFSITKTRNEESLIELVLKFFDPLMPRGKKMQEKNSIGSEHDHLLGLFHSTFLSSFKDNESHGKHKQPHCAVDVTPVQERHVIRCVTELLEAGVEFKKREGHDLLEIEFNQGVLEIPPLLIDGHIGPVFLNFVAYEHCHADAKPYFTHTVLFFDGLVNYFKDVELLRSKGILNHLLGSDKDVANTFNMLGKEVVFGVGDCYLSKQVEDVEQHCDSKWNTRMAKWKDYAKWKHDYFSSPWTFASFLAAVVLLFLTAVQTFFSVYSYVRPQS